MSGFPADNDQQSASRRAHWETAYREKPPERLSWRQEEPSLSLAIIRAFASPDDPIIDIGAGESALAARLADAGFRQVAALDISESAVRRAQERAGANAGNIRWIVADVLEAPALRPARLWHDRAVFHFLTDTADRRKYVQLAANVVSVGGHAVISTFATDGPERCSDLPVCRYDAESLAREFAPWFEPVRAEREVHTTPWGKAQPFTAVAFRRVKG